MGYVLDNEQGPVEEFDPKQMLVRMQVVVLKIVFS
jgi:hypothetical protein